MVWVAGIRTAFLRACAPFVMACGSTSDPEAAPNFGIIMAYERDDVWYGAATYSEPWKQTCSPEPVGECEVETPCTDTSTPPTIFEAGTVMVQGMPLERTISYFSPLATPFSSGDWIEMAATGSADVSAHNGSVRLPPLVTITTPTLLDGSSIDRSTDMEVAWTPVDDGSVAIAIASAGYRVKCSVPARRGRFSVPSAALQRLPATDATTSGSFSVTQANVTKLRPKGWEIWLSASDPSVVVPADLR